MRYRGDQTCRWLKTHQESLSSSMVLQDGKYAAKLSKKDSLLVHLSFSCKKAKKQSNFSASGMLISLWEPATSISSFPQDLLLGKGITISGRRFGVVESESNNRPRLLPFYSLFGSLWSKFSSLFLFLTALNWHLEVLMTGGGKIGRVGLKTRDLH